MKSIFEYEYCLPPNSKILHSKFDSNITTRVYKFAMSFSSVWKTDMNVLSVCCFLLQMHLFFPCICLQNLVKQNIAQWQSSKFFWLFYDHIYQIQLLFMWERLFHVFWVTSKLGKQYSHGGRALNVYKYGHQTQIYCDIYGIYYMSMDCIKQIHNSKYSYFISDKNYVSTMWTKHQTNLVLVNMVT